MRLFKKKFNGVDRCNETSLLEYGLLVYSEKHKDGSGSQFCVYKIDENSFGCGHIYENDINQLLKGEDWADSESLNEFFEYINSNVNDFLTHSLIDKLSDLKNYYGVENIFGSDYSPMSEKEVVKRYLKN